jgi:hypothetical protein
LLRACCVRQQNTWRGDSPVGPHAAPSSWFETPFPAHYDLFQHLTYNHTPFMSVAFPVSLFTDLNFRFDESLSTAEDWELTIRAVQVCGIACDPSVTAVYRWWNDSSSSRTEHSQEEWKENRIRIITKLNQHPFLLPPGSIVRVAELLGQLDEYTPKLLSVGSELERAKAAEQREVAVARAELVALLESPGWKKTKPLRKLLKRIRGSKKTEVGIDNLPLTRAGLEHEIRKIKKSSTWKLTKPLRLLAHHKDATRPELLAVPGADDPADVARSREHLAGLLTSPSWQKTAPMRKLLNGARQKKKPELRIDDLPSTKHGLELEILKIRSSSSWLLTRPLRYLAKVRNRTGRTR